MSNLTIRLRAEHKMLTSLLEEVRALGPSSEGLKKLQSAKTALLAHLKLEDVALYSVLNKQAEKDARLKSTLEMFASDMQAISEFALNFFEKYKTEATDSGEFTRDFEKLCSSLATRIRKEERTLHPEYDRIIESMNKAA